MNALSLCVPALINAVLSGLGLAINVYERRALVNVVFSAIFAALWTMLINNQCKAGRGWFAWTLLLLPYILVALILTTMVVVVIDKREQGQENFMTPLHVYNMDKWYNLHGYGGDIKYRFRDYPKIHCNMEKGCHCQPDKN